jgi:hypothetical protein
VVKQTVLAGSAILFLAACWSIPAPEPVFEGPDLAQCGADALQGLVGQPASVLQTMKFGQETRIIRPDMAVTMDFRADRLNIDIDRAERISRVYCS